MQDPVCCFESRQVQIEQLVRHSPRRHHLFQLEGVFAKRPLVILLLLSQHLQSELVHRCAICIGCLEGELAV